MTDAAPFDLAVRGGRAVLPGGEADVDVGIRGGLIAAVGPHLGPARRDLDARGKLVLPGGVDTHCHMDQPPWDGMSTADDLETGTLSALCGGTTTVVPFAMQLRGTSLSAAAADYRRKAAAKAHVDYNFHLIVGDPTRGSAGARPAAPSGRGLHVDQGLHDLRRAQARRRRVDARPRRRARPRRPGDGPRRERCGGALADRQARRRRPDDDTPPRRVAPGARRSRGRVPRHRAQRNRGSPDPHRPRVGRGRGGRDPPRAGARAADPRRNLPAISLPVVGRPRPPRPGGRPLRVHTAAPHGGRPKGRVRRACATARCRFSPPTTRHGSSPTSCGAATASTRCRTASPGSRRASPSSSPKPW